MKLKNYNRILIIIVIILVLLNLYLLYYIYTSVNATVPESQELNIKDVKEKDDYVNKYADEIKVTSPQPGDTITSGSNITGQQTNWAFEGDFSYKLMTVNGFEISSGILNVGTNWMDPGFKDFTGTIEFQYPPDCKEAYLIIQEDNPGLPRCKSPKTIKIPVKIK